jgi:hypothetical protein
MQTYEYYFEIEMINVMSKTSGVYIGVTTDPQQLNFGGNLDEFTTCAIYNTSSGNIFAKKFVHACKAATMKAGDIIGVVVDRTEDKFMFFINGVLVAIGEKKPSEFESVLYAFVNVFYAEQTIAICEKYSLRDLKANLH